MVMGGLDSGVAVIIISYKSRTDDIESLMNLDRLNDNWPMLGFSGFPVSS
jgi:hypothetical protein